MGPVGNEDALRTEGSTRGIGRMVGSSGHSVKLLSQSVNVSLELVKLGISPYGVNVHGFLGGWFVSA